MFTKSYNLSAGKGHYIIFIFAVIAILTNFRCSTKNTEKTQLSEEQKQPIQKTFVRLIGDREKEFIVEIIPQENNKDIFEIDKRQDKILLRGSSQTAIGYAFNWYLKYFCNNQITQGVSNINLPSILPLPGEKVRKECNFDQRYFLNYCTFNYTMSFWDWAEWERELDWMALNGVNLALGINGIELVWQNTLKKFNYSDQEIADFIPGPAYQAWWLMGNLEGWGGPVSQEWIHNRADLQKKIVSRMRELQIEPVFQGFFGMVPNSLIKKYPQNKIRNTGEWCGFDRPAFLYPDDTLFHKMAGVYYQEMAALYGETKYYGGDPFHEGGNAKNVDLSKAYLQIQDAMIKHNPNAVWVLQAWMDNPKPEALVDMKKNQVLVLDLFADNIPSWKHSNGFGGTPFIWNSVSNFGHRTDMYGRLQQIASEPLLALNSPHGKNLKGIGVMPEGSIPNPISYELTFEMAWNKQAPVVRDWVKKYSEFRYGKKNDNACKAWELLSETVYNCPKADSGGRGRDETQPIYCNRPSINKPWGVEAYYDTEKLLAAGKLLLAAADELKDVETYQYDLVDVYKDILNNKMYEDYKLIIAAYKKRDLKEFEIYSTAFLKRMEDLEALLGTNREFMLGPWIDKARKVAPSEAEQNLFELNSKILITWWGLGNRKYKHTLPDYAYKSWSGLISDYYAPRWKMFIEHCINDLKGKKTKELNFLPFEEAFSRANKKYSTTPQGNAVEIIKSLKL